MAIMADVAMQPGLRRRGAGAPARAGAGRPAGRLPAAGPAGGLRRRAGGLRRHALRPLPRAARRSRCQAEARRPRQRCTRAWFRPDNAILVLTGDITAEQGFALAEKAFGDWAQAGRAAAGRADDHARRASRARWPSTCPAPARPRSTWSSRPSPATTRTTIPAIVATTVLGGGYSARLNQEIRIKRGLSYGASAPALDRPHHRLVPRPRPDQERVRRRGAGPDQRRDDQAGRRARPAPRS